MGGIDVRRIEHEIRALPGVVACQFTETNALVLVGPDGDAAAVQAAVAAVLDAAASDLALSVLAAPRPVTAIASLARRRRRKAAFAMAGSAAALSASMAAAATVVVLGGLEVPDGPSTVRRTEVAAPITLLTEPPILEQLAPAPAARTLADKLIHAVDVGAPPADAAVASPAPGPVLISVPLPPALAGLEKAASRANRTRDAASSASGVTAPAPTPVVVAPVAPAAEVSIASAAAADGDGPPFGVARRMRKGNGHGPADQASPVATAEGAKDLPR